MQRFIATLGVTLALLSVHAHAQDGYELWLRYRPMAAGDLGAYRKTLTQIVAPAEASPAIAAAREELVLGLSGLLGRQVPVGTRVERSGAVVLGTPRNSSIIARLGLDLSSLGPEGYRIRSMVADGRRVTVIAANSDVGALYGAFALLRLIQTRRTLIDLDTASAPRIRLRTLNHWDNLDGTSERGYAGHSIFDWHRLPDWVDPRLTVYARANASIGINGAVLNNVNANATSLTETYLQKTAAIAAALRPYGIRVYLTARFSAPIEIGGLKTADPFDPAVRAWWRMKVDEIYQIIPDFGGFLVKANSESQPGPHDYRGAVPDGSTMTGPDPNPLDYRRTHADGANMLADAMAPHGGVVMWQAFVYSGGTVDRAMQAFNDFVPLDGTFRPNVVVQTKNGPIDFQPREPIHPLFGAMKRSAVSLELQITKEYLGQSTHLVYLATLWKEALDTDTYSQGAGSTVARVVDGSLFNYKATGIAGVANIGTDRNWSGSHFDQANWYAFGRLAWDHQLSAQQIAQEWVRMTFSNDERFVRPVVGIMLDSHEAMVDYMAPLGLIVTVALNHYSPAPWEHARPACNHLVCYKLSGIGVDRSAAGSNAVSQYAAELAAEYGDVRRTPEKFLLWFHHVPWDHRVASGRTVWDEMVFRYTRGVERVTAMRSAWTRLRDYADQERHAQVAAFLGIQEREARWWRDASIAYFQNAWQRPLPAGFAPPAHPLHHYQSLRFHHAPGNPGRTSAPFACAANGTVCGH